MKEVIDKVLRDFDIFIPDGTHRKITEFLGDYEIDSLASEISGELEQRLSEKINTLIANAKEKKKAAQSVNLKAKNETVIRTLLKVRKIFMGETKQ